VTKEQLLEQARGVNIHGRSSMSKEELAEAVEAEESQTKEELLERARERERRALRYDEEGTPPGAQPGRRLTQSETAQPAQPLETWRSPHGAQRPCPNTGPGEVGVFGLGYWRSAECVDLFA
jgi:hypothetical protein